MEAKESSELREQARTIAGMRIFIGVILAAFFVATFTTWIGAAEARTLALTMSATALSVSFQPHLRRRPQMIAPVLVAGAALLVLGLLVFFTTAR